MTSSVPLNADSVSGGFSAFSFCFAVAGVGNFGQSTAYPVG